MTGSLDGGRWLGVVLVGRPLVELARVTTTCSRGGILRRVGLRVTRGSFLKMVNPGKKKGAALVGVVLNLLGPSTKAVRFFRRKGRIGRVAVKCLPRCGAVSGGFPVSICRIILSKLGGRGSLFHSFSGTRRSGMHRAVTHVKLRNLRRETVKRLDNKRLRETLLKHTLISGPRIIVLSRPGACVSGHFRTHLCTLLRRVGGRYTVILIDRSVNAVLRGMGDVTYMGNALSCRPSARISTR